MPPKYLPFGEKAHEGIQFISGIDKEGFPIVEIQTGSYGEKVGKSIPKIIKQLADDGHNLIIDEVIWEKEDLKNYHTTLEEHQIYFIKITCDLPLIEEREKIRGDLDTNEFRPFDSARMILNLIGEQRQQKHLEKKKEIKTKHLINQQIPFEEILLVGEDNEQANEVVSKQKALKKAQEQELDLVCFRSPDPDKKTLAPKNHSQANRTNFPYWRGRLEKQNQPN
ncbi:11240_t:CDS:2 [Entrophospora sp. SA101]|nr:11240_t:CDS:2 [Entrophospora sp. SA101]